MSDVVDDVLARVKYLAGRVEELDEDIGTQRRALREYALALFRWVDELKLLKEKIETVLPLGEK